MWQAGSGSQHLLADLLGYVVEYLYLYITIGRGVWIDPDRWLGV